MKLIFSIFFISNLVSAKNIDEVFQQANSLMKQEKYIDAVKVYESILFNEPLMSEVFYNLGNAYYRLDSLGFAVWAYSKANLISPRNEDVIYNLNFVNSKLLGEVKIPNKFFFQTFYERIKDSFTFIEWLFIGSLFTMIFSVFKFIRNNILNQKAFFTYINIVLLSLVFLINILTLDKFTSLKNKEAIIVHKSSNLYSEPFSLGGTVLLVVNEGERLERMRLAKKRAAEKIENQKAIDARTCNKDFGFEEGTEAYSNCLMKQSELRQLEKIAEENKSTVINEAPNKSNGGSTFCQVLPGTEILHCW